MAAAAEYSRSRKLEKDNNGGQQRDRLSALPDCILVDILSFLPLKSAIEATTLSSRWRNLWKEINSVFVQKSSPVDILAVLPQLVSPVIRKVKLRIHGLPKTTNHENHSSPFVDSWFRSICGRKSLGEIEAYTSLCDELYPALLPRCVFQTQSLVVLKLGPGFDCDLLHEDGAEFTFNLPNFKKLRLSFLCCNCETLANLINSCPVLEDLDLALALTSKIEHVAFDISGYNLKRLSMGLHQRSGLKKVIMDTENLDYFDVRLSTPLRFSVVKNTIRTLGVEFWFMNPSENITCLVNLLHCCPVLEVLVLKYHCYGTSKYTWVRPNSTPACVLGHVKRIKIEIHTPGGNFIGLKNLWLNHLVKYFVGVAPLLEQLIVEVKGRMNECKEVGKREELLFCKELYGYPRCSSRCQVVFSGLHLKEVEESVEFTPSSDLLKDAECHPS